MTSAQGILTMAMLLKLQREAYDVFSRPCLLQQPVEPQTPCPRPSQDQLSREAVRKQDGEGAASSNNEQDIISLVIRMINLHIGFNVLIQRGRALVRTPWLQESFRGVEK